MEKVRMDLVRVEIAPGSMLEATTKKRRKDPALF
jgi:hypothetical protein